MRLLTGLFRPLSMAGGGIAYRCPASVVGSRSISGTLQPPSAALWSCQLLKKQGALWPAAASVQLQCMRDISTKREEGSWFRPASSQESLLHDAYEQGGCVIGYLVRISTTRKVTEQDCQKVFTSLYRKTPNLRLCLGQRDGKLWLRYMPEEKIDFKVVEGADANKTYHDMTHHRLDIHAGPLWAARLLPSSPCKKDFLEKTSMEESTKHPHVTNLVIEYHHSITDGHTCVRLLRLILTLLDDVISGKNTDDDEQTSELFDVNHDKRAREEIEKAFIKDPELLESRRKSFESCMVENLFQKAYPVPPGLKPDTTCIPHIVEKGLTQKFLARCKKERVTIHTGFCSLVETTVVKFLLNAGIEKDSYRISGLHAVNHRNMYSNCERAFGCGIGILDCVFDHPKEIRQDFWSNARHYHAKFKDQQKWRASLEHEVIENMTGSSPMALLDNNSLDIPSLMAHYASTNMLDVTKNLGECGHNVNLEYFDRMTTVFNIPCIFMNTFNTFRGQLLHSFQYNSHLIDGQTAQKVSNAIFELLENVVEE